MFSKTFLETFGSYSFKKDVIMGLRSRTLHHEPYKYDFFRQYIKADTFSSNCFAVKPVPRRESTLVINGYLLYFMIMYL